MVPYAAIRTHLSARYVDTLKGSGERRMKADLRINVGSKAGKPLLEGRG